MKPRRHFSLILVLLIVSITVSGCFLLRLIPAKQRPFTAVDLLVTSNDLPPDWRLASDPGNARRDGKPFNSKGVTLLKNSDAPLEDGISWEVSETIYFFYSLEAAKRDYKSETGYPGKLKVEEWTYSSSLADEQQFYCHMYPNVDYPICTWVARYDEIELLINGWINPKRTTIGEFQDLVRRMDEKVMMKLQQ